MIGVEQKGQNVGQYLERFAELEKRPGAAGNGLGPRLRELRREAMERFAAFDFPTTKNEQWRFTNVAPIARTAFNSASAPTPVLERVDLLSIPFAGLGIPNRLVFINGRAARDLSTLELPLAVQALSLAEALREGRPAIDAHLGRHASFDKPEHAFVALNTAFIEDGAFVYIPAGTVLETPLHLLFVSTAGGAPRVSHPRNLVVVGSEAQASIVESYVTLGGGAPFTNPVTELIAEEAAVVEYYRVQRESDAAFHVGTLQASQARSSTLTAHTVTLSGRLVRNDVNVAMDGEGAECTLTGLYVTSGEQHVDNHTVLDHAQPHCSSREYYKGVLDGKSSAVFNGGIVVRPDAQKTDAIQSNRNLLLSQDATINTKPQLQIWADDVRCTHGATIGQLDSEAVFYLQTRGIGREDARRLLTYAFANDVLGRMKVESVRSRLEASLFERLSH
jgi:Fe-S cluster assembly protein SufD